ncbi:uncharacterized protein FFUJ_13966 [Fusarium fujikuroi IMI 58289]|uniref:Uncharacterized protein n=2 Tax=Fusarium fujikuroi TaxID=5127 RepID=S0EI58_GIBF5|nr:uncharacterized protein FFUJ_13966 [Fusarium fujikuroi IMI 58289]KLO99657.1 uncharacterized protein Y057_7315 [Fusarium fujikuroi]KLP01286.1 uncharacterized protein LW94_8043 [Fusarium fujikuroi]QGI67690.1 hypothetical protein CEK27_011661 [Fusarium fujikuroi]QGI98575.1 hypothetical protein CEK26_011644 [Fusarium fujikuroi]CCT72038.1 uncharacterized protein FFUJ_13966 [Fusarium fujikuroi IMI 58289]
MRSVIHLQVVFGLLAIGSAIASPCKPLSASTTSATTSVATISTTVTSDASTETSVSTSFASTTEDEGATSSTVVEFSTETYASSTETSASSAETSESSITVETSAASATATDTTETTTAEPTTTGVTTTVAETTSSAAIPTFTMFASGSNAVAGRSLQTYNRDGAVAVFDPATEDDNPSVRSYSIDSQGRIVNDLGWFLCGYYGATNEEPNRPATVVTCHSETPLQKAFLTCELSGPFGIECSVPALSCVSSGSSSIGPTCIPTTGTWSLNSVGVRAFGHTWLIGGSDTPATYERMTMSIREV